MKLVQPLCIKLFGNSNMDDLLDPEDKMTLVGTSQAPGFLLRAVMKEFEKMDMKDKENEEVS